MSEPQPTPASEPPLPPLAAGWHAHGAPYALAVTALLGLLTWFYWPTLGDGLFADDYVATAILDGHFAAPRGPLDLFNFSNGRVEDVHALRQLGSVPWWAPEDFRIAFLRPLSSALWHVDRALFGQHYGAFHAHSLAVFFLLVICASRLYLQLFPPVVALVATLLFAVDDSHRFPVVWLSNRGGIYALMLGLVALLLHLRFRETGRARYWVLSAAASCTGLLFGEWVMSVLGYLVMYELLVVRAPLGRKLRVLLPTLVPCAVFLVMRAVLHYGARGSGAYVDPGAEPLRFLLAVWHRVPVFFADMVWDIPSEWWDHGTPWRDALLRMWIVPPDVWLALPDWRVIHWALGISAMLAVGLASAWCRAGMSERERRHLAFLVLGAIGSLVPVVGSFPSTRLTIASFWGLAPLFALVLRELTRRLRSLPLRASVGFAARFALYGCLLGLIVHLQLFEPLSGNVQAQVDHYATTREWVLAAELDPAKVSKQRVIMLAGMEFTTTFFFSYIWAHAGRPLPRSYYPITATPCAHYLQRTAANELVLHALGGSYLASGDENMFQSPQRVWREGESIDLDGMRVRVEQVAGGVPSSLRLTFALPLEDPGYVFLISAPHGIVRIDPPLPGEQRLISRAAHPSWNSLERFRFWARMQPIPEPIMYGSFPGFLVFRPPDVAAQ